MQYSLKETNQFRLKTNFSNHISIGCTYFMYIRPAERNSENQIIHNYKKLVPDPKLVWLENLSQGNRLHLGKVSFYQAVIKTFDICNTNYTQVAYDIHCDTNLVSFGTSEVIVAPRYRKELKMKLLIKNSDLLLKELELKNYESLVKLVPRSISFGF